MKRGGELRLCPVDLPGFGLCAALLSLVVFGQVVPSFRSERELRQVRNEVNAAQERMETVSAANNRLAERAATTNDALRGLVDGTPHDASAFLEFLTDECRGAECRIEQIEPAGAEATGAWTVRVRATGAAPALHRLLARVEGWSPFLRVPRWSVDSGTDAKQTRLEWTVQLRRPSIAANSAEARRP